MSYYQTLGQHIAMLNIGTKLLLIPDDYWLQNSRLEAMVLCQGSIPYTQPSKKLSDNSLDHMKSLHFLAPFHHSPTPDSLQAVTPVFHMLNVGTSNSKI